MKDSTASSLVILALIAALLFFSAPILCHSSEFAISSAEELPFQAGDEKEISVSIYQLRQGLWYKENWKLEKDRAEEFKKEYSEAKRLAEKGVALAGEIQETLEGYKLFFYVGGGILVTSLLITSALLLLK